MIEKQTLEAMQKLFNLIMLVNDKTNMIADVLANPCGFNARDREEFMKVATVLKRLEKERKAGEG